MKYERLTSKAWAKNKYAVPSYKRLAEIEDKIEKGMLVDCIWFISWLNKEVCCGQVIGYEKDSGFVVVTNNSMIRADKIWTNREEAEKELKELRLLISVRPQWVEKIANGEKTIEVRKTKPKIETPFKCYIYCTKGNGASGDILTASGIKCGRVIGEFVCDRMYEFTYNHNVGEYNIGGDSLKRTCLTYCKLENYGKGEPLYGWHISKLKIYDKPKNLSDFGQKCKYAKYQDDEWYGGWFCYGNESIECDWQDCPKCGGENEEYEDFAYCMCMGKKPLTRPPQSWCYVVK